MKQFKDLKIITNSQGQIAIIFLIEPNFDSNVFESTAKDIFCLSYRQYFFIDNTSVLKEEDVKIFQKLFNTSCMNKEQFCEGKIFNVDTLIPVNNNQELIKPREGKDGGVVGFTTP